jgi:nucleoside-diphosphate-sugar epimerase
MISKRKKKILVLGGTGTMGVYLVPELADMGYQVNVVSLDNVLSNNPSITYVQADAKDISFLHLSVKLLWVKNQKQKKRVPPL